MPTRSVDHAIFTIERDYPTSSERVFNHFADPALKGSWFAGPPEWQQTEYTLDFREGGKERSSVKPPGGEAHSYDALYHDIVQDERIVFTYEMSIGDNRISISIATIQITATAPATTHVTFTEQGTFLDGYDDAGQREAGTHSLLDALGSALALP